MNYFHWQKWLRGCESLDMKCWAVGEMFRKAWEYFAGRKLLPCPSLFQWPHLYPTMASHCHGLNLCTIFISSIPICDIHPLSFQFILSTAPASVNLWASAGTKIHWSYFSWPLTPFTLSLSIWLIFCHPSLSCLLRLHTLVLLSLCHTHLAKPSSSSIQLYFPALYACPCEVDCGWGCSHLNCFSQIQDLR